MKFPLLAFAVLLAATLPSFAGEKLKLNPHLDFNSDSQDGPLITGDHMEAGMVAGKPSYVLMYGEGCFNSKRQARRTVDLYARYQGQVQFVVIDIDGYLSSAQRDLKKHYFQGRIPHVMVFDRSGTVLYNRSGEVDSKVISGLLDRSLR
jgi:thiol-disulfide isomerase/thioredoxin